MKPEVWSLHAQRYKTEEPEEDGCKGDNPLPFTATPKPQGEPPRRRDSHVKKLAPRAWHKPCPVCRATQAHFADCKLIGKWELPNSPAVRRVADIVEQRARARRAQLDQVAAMLKARAEAPR